MQNSGAPELPGLISKSLQILLSETMVRADADYAFIINPLDPGMIETLKPLTAAVVSTSPGPGRKPIVSHANHVLYGWDLLVRTLQGDMTAFPNADWSLAWQLEAVDDAEWKELLDRMESTAGTLLELAPRYESWNELMLTGTFASIAHNAYHLGAIRQILLDVEKSSTS